jgi:hypothetical protein
VRTCVLCACGSLRDLLLYSTVDLAISLSWMCAVQHVCTLEPEITCIHSHTPRRAVCVLGVDFMSENVRAILDESGYTDVQVSGGVSGLPSFPLAFSRTHPTVS